MQDPHAPPPDDGHIRLTAADLTGANAARLGVSDAARTLAERVIALVPTITDRHRPPADLVREVLRIRRIYNELLARTITAELMRGASWNDIVAVLGVDADVAAYQYRHLDWDHIADDPQAVWTKLHATCVADLHETCPADPADGAGQLDAWVTRHYDPREAVPGPSQPVSSGLLPG